MLEHKRASADETQFLLRISFSRNRFYKALIGS